MRGLNIGLLHVREQRIGMGKKVYEGPKNKGSARHTFDGAVEDRKKTEDRSPDVISSCSQISSKELPGKGSMLYTARIGIDTHWWPTMG